MTTEKNISTVIPIMMRSEENSPKKPRNSDMAQNLVIEMNFKLMKEAAKERWMKVLEEFDEKLDKLWEEERQAGLSIRTAIEEIDKSFKEERALFKEVQRAGDECVNANLNYAEKSRKLLVTRINNKRRLEQFLETFTSEQEGPSRRKTRKM